MDDKIVNDVEFVADEENSGGNSLSGESKLKRQTDKLEKINSEKEEYLLNWQKERADFLNYKKDEESRINRARAIGFERGVMGVIKMLDTFDMAMGNQDAWNTVDPNWRVGVEYIYNQGLQFLEENGISIINPNIGNEVNPNEHDAIEKIESENIDENLDGKIARVIQKGYKNKDSVIRPAKVAVY